MWRRFLVIACVLCYFIGGVHAKIELPGFFTDNMVLQQNSSVVFKGKAEKNKKVTVKVGWANQEYHTIVDSEGKWNIRIPTPQAGGPYDIILSDGLEKILRNVLIGEVWLCSGQSNMEMPLAGWGKVMNYKQEIMEANYPSIRLFQVKKSFSLLPLDNLESTMGGWQVCMSSSVPEFSALAYFYARQLWRQLSVPIGVIDCSWGGTPAEAWTSFHTIRQTMGFEDVAQMFEKTNFDVDKIFSKYNEIDQEWRKKLLDSDGGLDEGKPVWADRSFDDTDWNSMILPVQWEKNVLPDFDGVVWFRKEIQIPDEWANKPLTFSLGMIDDEDIVFLNGEKVASGKGFDSRRIYTVPAEKIKGGKSLLTIRVFDTGGEGGITGAPELLSMWSDVKHSVSLAGEWKYNIGVSLQDVGRVPVSPLTNPSFPTMLYNGMIHPLISFPIKGVIWYQGEANVGRDIQYESLFQGLIHDWRTQFGQPEMPFYFVQLANYLERKTIQPESQWAVLRESQAKALHLNHTAMVTTIDIGEADDIHPKNKQEVARRLALCALSDTYGKDVIASAPQYETYWVCGNKVYISFSDSKTKFNEKNILKGFIMAGPDHCFHEAQAHIEGNLVVVKSPDVEIPIAVRYGWADNPECTLFTTTGLPVSPFRTDNWR